MAARRSTPGLLLVQAILLFLCAASALVFASWLLGYNGLGLVDGRGMPDRLQEANGPMSEPALVRGRTGLATVAAANDVIGGLPTGEIRPGDGSVEFYGNQANLSFWAPTSAQHAAWVVLRALPPLGLAAIWWLLFAIVRDVRRGRRFTGRIAARMGTVGALVLVGVPLLQLARWEVARWLITTSKAAAIAQPPRLHVDLWPFAVGLVILVMASAWREAVRMRQDLDGLV